MHPENLSDETLETFLSFKTAAVLISVRPQAQSGGDSIRIERRPAFDKPAPDQFVINSGGGPRPESVYFHPTPEVLPVFRSQVQPEEPVFVPKPGNFPVSVAQDTDADADEVASDDDLKAFHDELDRLINGENPNGEFKSFFRNPSSITFETVDGSSIEISDDDLTIVTIAPVTDFSAEQTSNGLNPATAEDQYVSFNVGPVVAQPVSTSPGRKKLALNQKN